MREDVAQPLSPLSPPRPSIPSCGQRGLPALGPAGVLLLCSFHVNLLISPAPKPVSELPGGALGGVAALPLGEHPRSFSPSCTQLLFLLALSCPGMGRGHSTGQL